jgi:hypothetical protein
VIHVDGEGFRRFQRDLKAMEPALAKDLKKELRGVLESKIAPTARSNASWSTRIPRAIKPKVTNREIALRVDSKAAPHGRPFEGLQRGLRSNSSFRHPLFGNKKFWFQQSTRPYLAPAFLSNHDEAVKAAREAVGSAARAAGFR